MGIRPRHQVPKFSLRNNFPDFQDCSLEPTLIDWLIIQKDFNPSIKLPDGSTISKYELVLEIESFFMNLNYCIQLKFNDNINNSPLLYYFDNISFERVYSLARFPENPLLKDFIYSVALSLHFSLDCQKRFRRTGVLRYDLPEETKNLFEVARMSAVCNTAVVNLMNEVPIEV